MDALSIPQDWLSRLAFQRALGVVYVAAFVCAANQFRVLIGERGLLPVPGFTRTVGFWQSPSLFHLHYSDRFFGTVAWTGVALSFAAVLGLTERGPLWLSMLGWFVLWVLYLSIVNVGQTWYGFGWESLLLEAGFLAIFLGSSDVAPPVLAMWLLRWLVFRVEFGAGLIKLRGDGCWRDLTCLYYHHETQPMPNPLSWYFHHLPKPLHKVEVAGNHVAQLIVPFGLFTPQPFATVAALVIIGTQGWLVLSGNFSWLNAITITLALSAVDGEWLGHVLPVSPPSHLTDSPSWHAAVVIALAILIVILSYWPVRNLFSRRQLMNASFNRIHLVNTYGAFGSITRIRHEIIIEGTDALQITPTTVWKEYDFKGKPGNPRRRPPQVAPYHLRLDWLMWFAALSPSYSEPWLVPFIVKLLENDRATLKLLRTNPFSQSPPAFIRARFYRYRFTSWRERRETGAWWSRALVGEYLPPMTLKTDRARAIS